MKAGNTLASVIVSSYNHQNYILNALNSIKSRNAKDIEVIIVDDCSTDESQGKIKTWGKTNKHRFARINIICHKKQYGISNVILEMVKCSQSNLLIPLASDDMYLPETVDKRIQFLNDNEDIWVGFSDACAINQRGEVIQDSLYAYYKHQFADRSKALLKKELILSWNYPANIQFWRKGDWINEISPDKFSEDVEIALAALSKNKIKYLNKVLYQYRCANWPIEAKGCEKTKRLHLAYYYRKQANKAWGISKYAFQKLSDYNQSLVNGDVRQAKKDEKKMGILKKIPSIFFS
jgi:glycosyltransferase involved in cell wall biosynthesis